MSNRSMSLTQIPGLTLLHRGKVRDVYALPGNELHSVHAHCDATLLVTLLRV